MTNEEPRHFVLAIYPFSRGIAFVLFEGPESPFDWGVRLVKNKHKNRRFFALIKKLMDRYRPEVMVIEDTNGKINRRSARTRKLYRMLVHLAIVEFVDVRRVSRAEILSCFASIGATSKYEIAEAIARQIPAFVHRLPPFKKPWQSEDPRQSLFDAAALAVAYYARGIKSPYQDEV